MGRSRPLVLIFTDLDGTLLDHHSYGWEEAKPALEQCRRRHVPVVLVSSKTRAEMEVIRHQLGLADPFISENGGGIFFPDQGSLRPPHEAVLANGLWKWSLGSPYQLLVGALREIREELKLDIRGFSDMSPEEISQLTGLDLASSRLASQREYDEPFIIEGQGEKEVERIQEAVTRRGLKLTIGGRFYHLHGENDKGKSVERLIAWYRGHHGRVLSVALGDSPNDFSMLERVDHPVLIRSSRHYPRLPEMIPRLKVSQEQGPRGWNGAVLDILRRYTAVSD